MITKSVKITPSELIDLVMGLELPSHIQTNIYHLAKSVDGLVAQNKLLLVTCIAIMAEFNKSAADDVLDGKAKVALSKSIIDKVSKRAEDNREKPIICYTEKDGEGFVGIKWVPVDHVIQQDEQQ
jgi:hypothetical protein